MLSILGHILFLARLLLYCSTMTFLHFLGYPLLSSPQASPALADVATQPSGLCVQGVIKLPKNLWGAQVEHNEEGRIWLGSFTSHRDATMAYSRAAMKLGLRGVAPLRPIAYGQCSAHESGFQSLYSEDDIVTFIRNDTYNYLFARFLEQCGVYALHANPPCIIDGADGRQYEFICEKKLIPRDVGPVSRFVVPKCFSNRFLPAIKSGAASAITLRFFDRQFNEHRFRYSVWKGTNMAVISGGWKNFVRSKGLKPDDKLMFYHSNGAFMIDVLHEISNHPGLQEAKAMAIAAARFQDPMKGDLIDGGSPDLPADNA